MIRVVDLHKTFGRQEVLRGINVEFETGKITTIIGGSGSGKTVLLKHLNALLLPDRGGVLVDGRDITKLGQSALNEVRQNFGMLFQSGALLQSLTVGENVALPIVEHGKLDASIIDLMVKMKLEMVGLTGFEHLKPAEISGGMKKRVGLARALAIDPELLFSDEPTAGLDPIMTAVVDELTVSLTKKLGVTAVVVTHDMTSAFRIATRMIMLGTGANQGKIVASGSPEEMRNHPNPEVQQFINGEADGPVPLRLSQDDYVTRLLGRPRHKRTAYSGE